MAIILGRFKVHDQATWRKHFEGHVELRKSHGCTGTHVFYNANDPNEIVVNFQWDSAENFQAALANPEVQKAMQESGMAGPPDLVFLEDGGRTDA